MKTCEDTTQAFVQGLPTGSQTLLRWLDVLEMVASGPAALGAIARQLKLSCTTAYRLAATRLERRYLNSTLRRGYSLGPKLLELGMLARDQISLLRIRRSHPETIAAQTGDLALLAVRDGACVLLADQAAGCRRLVPSLRPATVRSWQQAHLALPCERPTRS